MIANMIREYVAGPHGIANSTLLKYMVSEAGSEAAYDAHLLLCQFCSHLNLALYQVARDLPIAISPSPVCSFLRGRLALDSCDKGLRLVQGYV
jgi:hypothetical protein